MVLKLKELCLTFISKEFWQLKNFDHTLLSSQHKEIIIERLANHSLFNYRNKYNNFEIEDESFKNEQYRQKMLDYFFDGFLTYIKFNSCSQLDDSLCVLISKQKNTLKFKSLLINRCHLLKSLIII